MKKKSLKLSDKSLLRYSLQLPQDFNKNKEYPLVVALHYGWDRQTGVPEYYSLPFLSEFISKAYKDLDAIIVAPDCPADTWYHEKSENAVLELRSFFMSKYLIDTSLTIVTGFSAGGIGTWYYAANHSDKFPIAIPIAGYPDETWIEKIRNVQLYVVNSLDDKVISVKPVQKAVGILKEKNVQVYLDELEYVGHYQMNEFIEPIQKIVLSLKK